MNNWFLNVKRRLHYFFLSTNHGPCFVPSIILFPRFTALNRKNRVHVCNRDQYSLYIHEPNKPKGDQKHITASLFLKPKDPLPFLFFHLYGTERRPQTPVVSFFCFSVNCLFGDVVLQRGEGEVERERVWVEEGGRRDGAID